MTELLVQDVGKRYEKDRWALRNVNLRLDGGVVGLVGPNGAGKTTLLRVLATALRPTEGSVFWSGHDCVRQPQPLRQTLGYLPQDFGVYPQLTAREFLTYLAELKGLSGPLLVRRVEAVLSDVGLSKDAGRRLRAYSGGMIRRIGIAQALLNEPRLLLLDEPTVGLDPAERLRLRELLAGISGDRLVILSTHIIADVEAAATQIVLLQDGRLTWTGSTEGLLADVDGQVWSLVASSQEFERLRASFTISAAIRRPEGVHVRLVAAERPHPDAVPVAPTLEDAYMRFADDGAVPVEVEARAPAIVNL